MKCTAIHQEAIKNATQKEASATQGKSESASTNAKIGALIEEIRTTLARPAKEQRSRQTVKMSVVAVRHESLTAVVLVNRKKKGVNPQEKLAELVKFNRNAYLNQNVLLVIMGLRDFVLVANKNP